jgi:aspartate aminotransferase
MSHVFINTRSSILKPSLTFEMAKQVSLRTKNGLPSINLGIGEPDFQTPKNAKEAGIEAIKSGFTRYTASGGITELKEAILEKYKGKFKEDHSLSEVTCSNGGKQILFNAFQVLLEPGEEVLITDPAWLSYESQVQWAGGKVIKVPLSSQNKFKPTASDFEKKITEKTKIIVLNSPSNPTGAIIEKEEMFKIATLAKKHKLFIITDDVYEDYYFDQKPTHILDVAPELKEQTLIVNSVSKRFAMTGWRIGYALGPQQVISKMQALQSQSTSNPCSVAQKAALAALTNKEDDFTERRMEFIKRKNFLMQAFQNLEGYEAIEPGGAFYMMIKLPTQDDFKFCMDLVQTKGVALIPGSAFGEQTRGYARLAFSKPTSELERALELLTS